MIQNQNKISLISPSGDRIASSISELNLETSRVIYNDYGKEISFEIVDIHYFAVKVGYAYLLTYRFQDGTTGNYAVSLGNNYKLESSSLKVSNEELSYHSQKALRFTKVKVTCGGTCEKACTVTAVFDTNTGTITYGCGCSTCTMTTELQ